MASHGWLLIDCLAVPEEKERTDVLRATEALHRVCGQRPVGRYKGWISETTRRPSSRRAA